MKIKIFFALLFLVLITHLSIAQRYFPSKVKIDSLTQKLAIDSARTYRFNKFRPFGNLDNRNSFIQAKPVNFNGLQLGFIYKEYHMFGIGVYKMSEQSKRPYKSTDNNRNIIESLTLNYSTIFYQYVLLDKRYFEIDLPFEIGFGKFNLKYEDSLTKQVYKNFTSPIVPFGAGMQFIFKPIKWVGVSVAGGYRYVAKGKVNLNFNGVYYSFGAWIDIRQIYRDIKYYGFQKRKYKKNVRAIKLIE